MEETGIFSQKNKFFLKFKNLILYFTGLVRRYGYPKNKPHLFYVGHRIKF